MSPAVELTHATQGALRLTGFVTATNGSTVVYRRDGTTTPSTSDLPFVRTATPKQDVHVVFPGGAALVQDAHGNNQFGVSSAGQWIVAIARDGSSVDSAYATFDDSETGAGERDGARQARLIWPASRRPSA
jgi:hypothetical protein